MSSNLKRSKGGRVFLFIPDIHVKSMNYISLKDCRAICDRHMYAFSIGKQPSHSRLARRLYGYDRQKENSETKEDEQTRKRYLKHLMIQYNACLSAYHESSIWIIYHIHTRLLVPRGTLGRGWFSQLVGHEYTCCKIHATFLYCRKRARMQCVREMRQRRKVADVDTTAPEVRYTCSD